MDDQYAALKRSQTRKWSIYAFFIVFSHNSIEIPGSPDRYGWDWLNTLHFIYSSIPSGGTKKYHIFANAFGLFQIRIAESEVERLLLLSNISYKIIWKDDFTDKCIQVK